MVRRAYGLVDAAGTRFFDFGTPAQVAALAHGFRQALGSLPLDKASAQQLVDEALWSFDQHVQMFEQVARHLLDPATPHV